MDQRPLSTPACVNSADLPHAPRPGDNAALHGATRRDRHSGDLHLSHAPAIAPVAPRRALS